MKFLIDYIQQFREEDPSVRSGLADELESTKKDYDVKLGGNPVSSLQNFVERYNWLGNPEIKDSYDINRNLARNLPGALMQDYLLNLAIVLCQPHPQLDVFTEVRVPFGNYPLWESGEITLQTPSERSDIAIGYLVSDGEVVISDLEWPKEPFTRLERNHTISPLVTLNSKIRVSQSEFFDWYGREQLMTKGNPHCLSVQVALRKEMDMSIVQAAQSWDRFFLLGDGTERNVIPNDVELERLVETISEHLEERMLS